MVTACRNLPSQVYKPRAPQNTLLYKAIISHFNSFSALTGHEPLPSHIEREFSAYIRCGIRAYGFARLKCTACDKSYTIPFSCKGRGFCPSCMGRRMNEMALHLTEDVLPTVPIRQFVLSLPKQLRYLLAYNPKLTTLVLRVFVKKISSWYKRRCSRSIPFSDYQTGAITFVQRFGSSLNLNLHFHTLFLDGVYQKPQGDAQQPTFFLASKPKDEEIKKLSEQISATIIKLLDAQGVLERFKEQDPLLEQNLLLAQITGASIKHRIALGENAPSKVRRILQDPHEGQRSGHLCFSSSGFSLHAATHILAWDRKRLLNLCCYIARPPLSNESLEELPNGDLTFKLKTPWDDGTTHLVFTPTEFIEKLAAIIPPPRFHQLHYHGILAPNAKLRSQVVPKRPVVPDTEEEISPALPPSSAKRSWAQLLKHVYDIDMKVCPACGGEMKIIAFITPPCEVKRYLEGTGESTETPYFATARASPTMDLFRDSHPDSDDLFAQEAAYQDMEEVQHHPEEF